MCVCVCVCVCGVHRCMEITYNKQGHVLRGPAVCGFETSGHLPLEGPTTKPRAIMIAAPVDFVVRKECELKAAPPSESQKQTWATLLNQRVISQLPWQHQGDLST